MLDRFEMELRTFTSLIYLQQYIFVQPI